MGLLDDAIREHLDLKRRSGSDPAEVERLEREALGPVRRERSAATEPEAPASTEAAAPSAPAPLQFEGHDDDRHERPSRSAREEALPDLEAEPDEDFDEDYEEPRRGRRRGLFGRRRRAEPEYEDEFEDEEFDDHDEFAHHDDEYDHEDEHALHEDEHAPHAEPPAPAGTSDLPPHLEFDSEPPRRPRFGDLPARGRGSEPEPVPEPNRTPEPEPTAHAEPPVDTGETVEHPVLDPDATMVHRIPEDHFPDDEEAQTPRGAHGDPLEDVFEEFGDATMEHDVAGEFTERPRSEPHPHRAEPAPRPPASEEPQGPPADRSRESRPPAPPEPRRPAPADFDDEFAPRRPAPRDIENEPRRRRAPDEPPPEGEEGEDLLEETPDFLQDTPDHDRLWFEQRPPRDFDFDG